MPRLRLRFALGPMRPAITITLPFIRHFSAGPNQPTVTRYLVRQPNSLAPRECPTPLVFVRARGLLMNTETDAMDREKRDLEEVWNDWSGMFAEKGYTALEVDITAPNSSSSDDGVSPLGAMTTLLASQIRLLAIPFPPILISSGSQSGLLTQAYIEDNPASGLVLVNPPSDDDPRGGKNGIKGDGEGQVWKWPKFGYEGTFPILLLGDVSRLKGSRVGIMAEEGIGRGGKGVVIEGMSDGPRGEKSRITVERWMDSCGF